MNTKKVAIFWFSVNLGYPIFGSVRFFKIYGFSVSVRFSVNLDYPTFDSVRFDSIRFFQIDGFSVSVRFGFSKSIDFWFRYCFGLVFRLTVSAILASSPT